MLERDARIDDVRTPCDGSEHALCVGPVKRLLEEFFPEEHRRVGSDDPSIRMTRRESRSLVAGKARDVLLRSFPFAVHLGDFARKDVEVHADRREQFSTPRRRRSQDEFHVAEFMTRMILRIITKRPSVTIL